MRRELLGGPLLGRRGSGNEDTLRRRFEPIITPVVGRSNNPSATTKTEQFILLPHEQFIEVLAFTTGQAVAKLVPFSDLDGKIESVCLAAHPRKPRSAIDIFDQIQTDDDIESEQRKAVKKRRTEEEGLEDDVALIGCNDGTIREFPLLALLASSHRPAGVPQNKNCGLWEQTGTCHGPRRIFKVTGEATRIRHLTAPPVALARAEYGLLVYALAEPKVEHSKIGANEGLLSLKLIRLTLPPYFDDSMMVNKSDVIPLHSKTKRSITASRLKVIGKLSCEKRVTGVSGDLASTEPFCLESLVRDGTQGFLSPNKDHFLQQKKVFVIVGRPTATHVFCERLADIGIALKHSKKDFSPVTYRNDGKKNFCSLAVSLNNNDVAFGYESGAIVIVSNFLSQVEQYHAALAKYECQVGAQGSKDEKTNSAVGLMKPDYPFKNAVEARVHWHANPVTTLCYDANSSPRDPILYSGGEESVLITWQQSRGISRPADLLPRIAPRGICFIGCSKRSFDGETSDVNDTILVFCEDNSLQLFDTHNKRLLWKVQGVAAIKGISSQGLSLRDTNNLSLARKNPLVTMDPMTCSGPSPLLILIGIPDAPGVVQWYDIAKQRVASHLEITSYNRVSGTEYAEKVPMPTPLVTHVAFSSSGSDLLTVEQVPTENRYVGATEAGNKHGDVNFGFVTIVKFWAWDRLGAIQSKSNKPYRLVAAMARAHGAENKVSAIAMSSGGRFACTASNDENAFRLWQKVDPGGQEDHDLSSRRLPVWSCQYKITTPAGYSNHPTGANAIAFSSDSSILAICYGHMLTLWDRCNMTLLTSNHHFDEEDIDSVEFLKTDIIMCKSQSGVSIQSPFGAEDLSEVSWCWTVLDKPASVVVSCAQYFESHNVVAISIYYGYINRSRIVLINATSGDPVEGQEGAIIEHVPGVVCSIGEMGRGKVKSNWRGENSLCSKSQMPLVLFALTSEGLLVSLREGSATEDHAFELQLPASASTTSAPRLPSTANSNHKPAKKRRRTGSKLKHLEDSVSDKNLSMVNFGSSLEDCGDAVPLPTSALPLLAGGFARAFVGRNLSRKGERSSQ